MKEMQSLSKVSLITMCASFMVIALVTILYGTTALIFLFALPFCFFVAFGIITWNAAWQAALTPGLERIDTPSFWSNIYNAWLYTTDREGWALLATIISLIFGAALWGSLLSWFILVWTKTTAAGIHQSWLVGMFFTCSIAITMYAEYWSKQS